MKRTLSFVLLACTLAAATAQTAYVPTADNLRARREFEADRFGIFIHWGLYSLFAQGAWYLNAGISEREYAKSAQAFYPHRFDAVEWVRAIKGSGARYITFTSRHHDGFSMFRTAESAYNIVDGTPFRRDVAQELAEACAAQGVKLHFYYSILDWRRDDYPLGRTGLRTGRSPRPNYDGYLGFMERQVGELLSGRYGDVRAVWLDGYWDHDADTVPFDWIGAAFGRRLEPGAAFSGNFYCCDETLHPHFGSWSPVAAPAPDFHRPECFGTLTLRL